MKILVVSDSHGNNAILQRLVKQYPNMDYYLHAGDSQSDLMSIYPFDSVLGNCDYYSFDFKRKIYTPMGYLLMKHYPIVSKEETEDVKFFIHGHTHKNELREEKDLITICPGALTHPRDGTLGSYALLDIEEKKATIKIIELETKTILNIIEIM